jgi:hypothetical protein
MKSIVGVLDLIVCQLVNFDKFSHYSTKVSFLFHVLKQRKYVPSQFLLATTDWISCG